MLQIYIYYIELRSFEILVWVLELILGSWVEKVQDKQNLKNLLLGDKGCTF